MAIRCGVSPLNFWELGLDEIVIIIDAYEKNKIDDMKTKIMMLSVQADQIAMKFSCNKEMDIPKIWDYYPGLFAKEKRQYEIEKEEDDLIRQRASRKAYAAMHNDNLKGGTSK